MTQRIWRISLALLLAVSAGVFISCNRVTDRAIVNLVNADGDPVGDVSLLENDEGVTLAIDIKDLPPGIHAFHIHENGDFTPPEFSEAGGHFNPFNKEHGLNNPKGPHAGDLPNIWVKNDRTCKDVMVTRLVTLKEGEPNSLFKEGGTSIVIHQGADDHESQPAGAAGPRIAGGIVKKR